MTIDETELNLIVCCLLILLFDEYVSLSRHDMKFYNSDGIEAQGTLTLRQKRMTRSDYRTV